MAAADVMAFELDASRKMAPADIGSALHGRDSRPLDDRRRGRHAAPLPQRLLFAVAKRCIYYGV